MNPRIWAVLPAAGIGRRMGTEIPKQYLPLAGRCVIQHSLELLSDYPRITGIVVATADDDPHWQKLGFDRLYGVKEVRGGNLRAESVLNALHYLLPEAGNDDWVLVHDAVRPCLVRRDLEALLSVALDSEDGAILAVPVRDTMKRVGDGRICETVPRDNLWQAQTPQMFPLAKLLPALEQAKAAGVSVTDEAQAMEREGFQPRVVEGRVDNIKITCPEDLTLAALYLQTATSWV